MYNNRDACADFLYDYIHIQTLLFDSMYYIQSKGCTTVAVELLEEKQEGEKKSCRRVQFTQYHSAVGMADKFGGDILIFKILNNWGEMENFFFCQILRGNCSPPAPLSSAGPVLVVTNIGHWQSQPVFEYQSGHTCKV